MPSDESKMIVQAKLSYSPLGKALETQTKTTEGQGKKVKVIKVIKPVKPQQKRTSIEGIFPRYL